MSEIAVWIVGVLAAVAALLGFLRVSVRGASKLQEFLDEWPLVLAALHEATESRVRLEAAVEHLGERVEHVERKLETNGNKSLSNGGTIADSLARLEAEVAKVAKRTEGL